jgi:ABC-2 type transport system ATP-binding protein
MTLIQAESLTKSFGMTHAVNGVSFAVQAGEIYGLVGSDGAGKTTTLRLLIGALRADSGTATICGYDVAKNPEKVRSQVGYLSQRFSLYEDLTIMENIRFFAELRGLAANEWKPRCLELLEFVGLSEFASRRTGALSGGMKQKLGLATALVTRPRVLLLDEPTTGVDPSTRQDFWQLIIRVVNREGMAVMLTTPYMDEASRCNRLGFMRAGRVIAEGTPSSLRAKLNGRILEIPTREPLLLRAQVLSIPGVDDARPFGDRLHVRTTAGAAEQVIVAFEQLAEPIPSHQAARLISPTLEDVFLSYITDPQEGL